MEEVFLKVGHLEDPTLDAPKESEKETITLTNDEDFEEVKFSLKDSKLDETLLTGILAVITRRLHGYKRNKKAVGWEVLLPACIFVAGLLLSNAFPDWRSPSRY